MTDMKMPALIKMDEPLIISAGYTGSDGSQKKIIRSFVILDDETGEDLGGGAMSMHKGHTDSFKLDIHRYDTSFHVGVLNWLLYGRIIMILIKDEDSNEVWVDDSISVDIYDANMNTWES